MNKKHLLVILVVICAFCCAFSLSACGDPGGNGGGNEGGGGPSKERIEVSINEWDLTANSTVEDVRQAATVCYYGKDGNFKYVTDYEISGSIGGAGTNTLTFRYNGIEKTVEFFVKESTYTLTFLHQGHVYNRFDGWQPSQGKPECNAPDSDDPWYEWVWEDYTIGSETNITINSQLVLKEFTITFTGYDNKAITRKFTKETVSIDEPEVPAEPGYSGKWYEYELEPFDFSVNAEYTANRYTVSFDFNGATSGNTAEPFEITFSYALPSLPAPEKEDKAFDGWYVGNTEISSGSIWNIPNDATLVARWRELKNCTVTFDSNSGSRVDDVNAKENGLLSEPAEPTKNDCLFAGWYKDEKLKNEWNFASGKVKDDMTLYAKWVSSSTGSAGLVYTLNGQAYTVTGHESTLSENVVIPSTYRNCPVTAIAERAFANSALKTVTIPESVTNVGKEAFRNCSNLTKVNYLGTIESWIDKTCVFDSFPKDYKLYINNTLLNENLVIPASVAQIKAYSFRGVSNIKTLTVTEGVVSIGSRAFANCKNMTEIRFNATACENIENELVSNVFANAGTNTDGINVKIGKNVTRIPNLLFYSTVRNGDVAPNITSISFENDSACESIGHNAFNGLKTLKSINIPSSITSIENDAFSNCDNLSVTIEDMTAWFDITFASGKANPMHCASSLFVGTKKMTYVTIPSSVTAINGYAFYGCRAIESVEFEANSQCTGIGIAAFSGCIRLRRISLPASLTNIYTANNNYNAFYGSNNIIEICNDSALQITKGSSDFGGIAKNVLNIYSSTSGESHMNFIVEQNFQFYFDEENGLILLSLVSYYNKPDLVLPAYVNNYLGLPGNYRIAANAFYGNDFITSITVPDTSVIISIGESAFKNCPVLTKVYCNGNLKAWCDFASKFENEYASPLCNGAELYLNGQLATEIEIPSSVTAIKPYTFYGCNSITNVVLHDGITSIGKDAFTLCQNLQFNEFQGFEGDYRSKLLYLGTATNPYYALITTAVNSTQGCVIHQDTVLIGSYAFEKCTYLGSTASRPIVIPKSVRYIDAYGFYGSTYLTSIHYEGTAEQWETVTKGDHWVGSYQTTTASVTVIYDGDTTA